jgi:hypothetical protein
MVIYVLSSTLNPEDEKKLRSSIRSLVQASELTEKLKASLEIHIPKQNPFSEVRITSLDILADNDSVINQSYILKQLFKDLALLVLQIDLGAKEVRYRTLVTRKDLSGGIKREDVQLQMGSTLGEDSIL